MQNPTTQSALLATIQIDYQALLTTVHVFTGQTGNARRQWRLGQ